MCKYTYRHMIQCDLLYIYTCICIKTHVWADRPATPTCSHDGRSPSAMDSSMRSPFAQRLAWTWSTAKILDLLDIWKYIHMRPHYTNFICGWIPHSLNKTWQNHIANPLPYKFFHLLCRQPHCWGIGKGARLRVIFRGWLRKPRWWRSINHVSTALRINRYMFLYC